MGNAPLRRVFVSSTFEDLADYRAAVRDVIRQLGAIDISMENLGARDERPVAECVRLVREETDVFVGIYAHRYGHIPSGDSRSITEIEYAAATDAAWPRFIYMVDEAVPWLVNQVDSGTGKKRLLALKQRLMRDHVCKRFANKDQLAAFVAADLGREFARRELPRLSAVTGTRGLDSSTPEGDWTKDRSRIIQEARNVFLVHTIEPSDEIGQEYDLSIYLAPHAGADPRYRRADLSDVDYAEFFLGAFWGNRILRIKNAGGLIGLRASAYGSFLCLAKVVFTDGGSAVLQRYVDFAMGPISRECRELRHAAQRDRSS